jgi:hypothetical protein
MSEFTCVVCRKTFTEGWSEEEAMAELAKNFPDVPLSECEILCEDCYRAMGFGDA